MWHQFTLHALTYCRLCKDAGTCRAPLMVPEPRLRYGQSGVEPETPRVPQLGSTLIIRSYQGESTGSHPNSEVKHPWACSVLRWGTTRESQVTNVLLLKTVGYGGIWCYPKKWRGVRDGLAGAQLLPKKQVGYLEFV